MMIAKMKKQLFHISLDKNNDDEHHQEEKL